MRRLQREITEVSKTFGYDIENDDIFSLVIALHGPDNSPYFGGTFLINFVFDKEWYPMRAPKITFATKICHPNISPDGRICLLILDEWNVETTLVDIISSILDIMKCPNADNPVVTEIGHMYKNDRMNFERVARAWTVKYAM